MNIKVGCCVYILVTSTCAEREPVDPSITYARPIFPFSCYWELQASEASLFSCSPLSSGGIFVESSSPAVFRLYCRNWRNSNFIWSWTVMLRSLFCCVERSVLYENVSKCALFLCCGCVNLNQDVIAPGLKTNYSATNATSSSSSSFLSRIPASAVSKNV
jgi:hypothetical protein